MIEAELFVRGSAFVDENLTALAQVRQSSNEPAFNEPRPSGIADHTVCAEVAHLPELRGQRQQQTIPLFAALARIGKVVADDEDPSGYRRRQESRAVVGSQDSGVPVCGLEVGDGGHFGDRFGRRGTHCQPRHLVAERNGSVGCRIDFDGAAEGNLVSRPLRGAASSPGPVDDPYSTTASVRVKKVGSTFIVSPGDQTSSCERSWPPCSGPLSSCSGRLLRKPAAWSPEPSAFTVSKLRYRFPTSRHRRRQRQARLRPQCEANWWC